MYIKYTQERDELRQSVERLSLDNSRHIEHVLELEKLYSSLRGGPREEQGEGKGGRNAEGGRGGGAEARNDDVIEPEIRDQDQGTAASSQSATSYPSPPPSRPAHTNSAPAGVKVVGQTGGGERMETEGGGDGEQSGSNSAPTKASGQPSDYLAERQQRLNVSWNVGVRARNAGGDASMMRGRPSFGMDGWEVEEEQRKDMSSSLVSHLGSPMVHGTGVSPPPPEPWAMSQSRYLRRDSSSLSFHSREMAVCQLGIRRSELNCFASALRVQCFFISTSHLFPLAAVSCSRDLATDACLLMRVSMTKCASPHVGLCAYLCRDMC